MTSTFDQNFYILVYDNNSWLFSYVPYFSEATVGALCPMCACPSLDRPTGSPSMGDFSLDQLLRFRASAFVPCVFCLCLASSSLYFCIPFFFFSPNDCCFASHIIQCCALFMAISKDVNKIISDLPLNILEQPSWPSANLQMTLSLEGVLIFLRMGRVKLSQWAEGSCRGSIRWRLLYVCT